MRIQHNIMAMNAYRNLSGNQNALSKNLEKLSSGYKINRAGDEQGEVTMRIQHNIMAMNAYRNLSGNQNALSKNLEKLSSGYKINRAGDDAAGLAISEKMRAQITGLEAAQKNVKDGIGLIKTAEGALQEVQDMMNRMVYLAEQSANGTYDEKVDRAALEDEVKALTAEINRIGETANFNGQKLLNGDLTKVSFQIGDSNTAGDKLAMSGIIGTKASQATIVDLTKAISVATQTKAQTAIDTLKGTAANPENGLINKISSLRGKLGATQNRLEHTSNNLGVMRENIQDAESNIRDTDVADEMMKYTKQAGRHPEPSGAHLQQPGRYEREHPGCGVQYPRHGCGRRDDEVHQEQHSGAVRPGHAGPGQPGSPGCSPADAVSIQNPKAQWSGEGRAEAPPLFLF